MAKIFLCHANEDKPQVREVYQRLKAEGYEPWLDEMDLLPGQLWNQEVRRALRDSDFILIFFSQNSVIKRGYVQREVKFALDAWQEMPEGMIYTIPVRLDDCEMPETFRQFQALNLFDAGGVTRLLKVLQAGLSQRQVTVQQGVDKQLLTSINVKGISDPLEMTENFFSQAGITKLSHHQIIFYSYIPRRAI